MTFKDLLRSGAERMPFPVTRNIWYDRLTGRVMQRTLGADSTFVDVGCHKGEVLRKAMRLAPQGTHFGFEPIPELSAELRADFPGASIFDCALSDYEGTSSFNLVETNMAYSGLRRRHYDRPERDRSISVPVRRLDDVLPNGTRADLVKIDVEGGEFGVLSGARELLGRSDAVVVFEHGRGAAEFYDHDTRELHDLLAGAGYGVYLMDRWLKHGPPLGVEDFQQQFDTGSNYYFVASRPSRGRD